MTDAKDNKQGQGGGPKTVLGKVSSSKNAVKHGITSQQLLNPDEARKFQITLQEFEQNYIEVLNAKHRKVLDALKSGKLTDEAIDTLTTVAKDLSAYY